MSGPVSQAQARQASQPPVREGENTLVVYEPFPAVSLQSFYPELRFEFKDLPMELYVYYIRRVAVDMAEKGNLLRRWVRIQLQPCVTRYALRSPDGLRMWAIMGVFRSPGGIDCNVYPSRRSWGPPDGACCCEKNLAWWDDYDQVLHYTGDCRCGALFVNMAVVPERDACELPKIYFDRFHSTLLMGVRAHIMLITGRPWTNLRVGGELMREYERMLSQDAITVAERQQRGSIKMQFGRVM